MMVRMRMTVETARMRKAVETARMRKAVEEVRMRIRTAVESVMKTRWKATVITYCASFDINSIARVEVPN